MVGKDHIIPSQQMGLIGIEGPPSWCLAITIIYKIDNYVVFFSIWSIYQYVGLCWACERRESLLPIVLHFTSGARTSNVRAKSQFALAPPLVSDM